jgi:predicted RNase H-like HicB family nuclease
METVNMDRLTVEAVWDDEASVWVATSDDITGLVTEADTLEDLRAKLIDLVPELLADNGVPPGKDPTLPIEIVARQHLSIAAA